MDSECCGETEEKNTWSKIAMYGCLCFVWCIVFSLLLTRIFNWGDGNIINNAELKEAIQIKTLNEIAESSIPDIKFVPSCEYGTTISINNEAIIYGNHTTS